MLRVLLAALLALAIPLAAHARPPMETNQLVDGDGVPLGTDANPLKVQGGTGGSGSSGSVTAPGTAGTQAQTVQGAPGGVPLPTAQQDGFRPWGTTGGTASAVQVLGPGGTPAVIDTTGYGTVEFQIVTLAAGASLNAMRSLDGGTTWSNIAATSEANIGNVSDTTALGGSLMHFPAGGLVRFNQTSYTSGTTQIVPILLSRGTPVRSMFATLGTGAAVIGSTTLRSAGTNRSLTVGTTATPLMPSNTARQGWKIKNDCANAIWINFDATATATPGGGNIRIAAGGYLASEPSFVETGAMSALAETSACAITAREQ